MFDQIKGDLDQVKSLDKIFLLGNDEGKKIFNWENFDNVSDKLKTEEMKLKIRLLFILLQVQQENQKDVFTLTLDL